MEIKEAIKLEDGGTYCIEYERLLQPEEREAAIKMAKDMFEKRGISFLILDGGGRLARVDEE